MGQDQSAEQTGNTNNDRQCDVSRNTCGVASGVAGGFVGGAIGSAAGIPLIGGIGGAVVGVKAGEAIHDKITNNRDCCFF